MIVKICILLAVIGFTSSQKDTLRLVHVIFRHGNRTLDSRSYPNDPYINETFYPFGFGQLTNKGRLRAYRLGVALRRRYGAFLGEMYRPEFLDAVSTNVNRTKMSLELVLAGLYPPANTGLDWNQELNWQPIPYNYYNGSAHSVLVTAISFCPRYMKLYNEFLSSPEALAIQSQYHPLFRLLSKHTGWNVTTNSKVLTLYNNLQAEEDFDLKLPNWTAGLYPEILQEAGGQAYVLGTYTNELRQLSGGFLLKKIIGDTEDKTKGISEKKLFLYSAHDGNLAWLLGALRVLYPHQPTYGAYIVFEVHEVDDIFGFQIFYQNYSGNQPVPIIIPGCDHFCSLQRFKSLLRNSMPQHSDQCNIDV